MVAETAGTTLEWLHVEKVLLVRTCRAIMCRNRSWHDAP